MKVLLITGVTVIFLSACSSPQQHAARTADSVLMTDTMPVLRPKKPADKMPVLPMDTTKSDMPVVRPADSVQAK